jgi:hypothetical protein
MLRPIRDASTSYVAAMREQRRFPPPWSVDEYNDACFIVRDRNRQALGYFYFEEEPDRRMALAYFNRRCRGDEHTAQEA